MQQESQSMDTQKQCEPSTSGATMKMSTLEQHNPHRNNNLRHNARQLMYTLLFLNKKNLEEHWQNQIQNRNHTGMKQDASLDSKSPWTVFAPRPDSRTTQC